MHSAQVTFSFLFHGHLSMKLKRVLGCCSLRSSFWLGNVECNWSLKILK